ncbi:hypothetical protein [Lentzea sp.]|uniref:hypothetical protein n=1 Tax=Lentzea sp. TaxID=56099 RepID=UPI002B79C3FE|nr:hypothetical protein [Lentzea sp.]HUQ60395.1 hypothetical protein [Lentzea sp.]
MLLRTVVGAVAGAVAGAGFLSTSGVAVRYCNGGPGRAGCGGFLVLVPPNLVLWIFVAGAAVLAGFRFLRQRHGWWVTGVGGALWILLVVAVYHVTYTYLDLYQAERGPVISAATVVAASLAFAVAALCIGRGRTA